MENIPVEEIWHAACEQLKQNMSSSTFQTWISANPLTEFKFIGDDRAIGVITSPTAFYSTNLEKNFYAQIKDVLDQVTGRNSELQFRVGSPISTPPISPLRTFTVHDVQHEEYSPPPQSSSLQEVDEVPQFSSQPLITSMQEKLREFAQRERVINSEEPQGHQLSSLSRSQSQSSRRPTLSGVVSPLPQGLFSQSNLQSMKVDRSRMQAQKAGLRLDYTFETFAVSTTNEMAHAAALAVSSQPGTAYNPLFIYGGVGVGKTHLMHAVGNNILKINPEAKILYCTGEDFTNEIVSAIQTKKTMFFKEKYRLVDVLLLDDIQFIAGKNTVQEEFFHTFNTITKRSGQVILTSDRPPHEIALLEDRLRSRFEAGLMVDIQQPSFELRTAILLIKATAYQLSIPMNLAQVIASHVTSARKIEGIMKTIKSEVELKHREINQELIDEIFKANTDEPKKQLRVKPFEVIKTVAEFYHIKLSAIRGKNRVQAIVRARHVAMYFLKVELALPYMEVGRWFSNRDHTSAMHALKKVNAEIHSEGEIIQEIAMIRSILNKMSR